MVKFSRTVWFLLFAWTALTAQEPVKWKDIDSGMRFPGIWVQEWLDEGHFVYRQERSLLVQNARNGETRPLIDPGRMEALGQLGVPPDAFASGNSDYSQLIYIHENDLYHFDCVKKELKRLTETKGEEQNPTLSPDAGCVAYTRDGNLYLQNLNEPGKEIALTSDGSETVLNGYASWVYYEEILGRRGNYQAFWFSPDSRKLVFLRFDQSQVRQYPVLWFNELYGKLELQRYPKPGTPNPEVTLQLADIRSGTVEPVKIPETEGNYLAFPRFSEYDGHNLYVQWLNRDQDHFRIYEIDMKNGKSCVAYEETQPAWIDFLEESDLIFLPGRKMILRSSRDGWFHLYRIDGKGGVHQLTRGEWSVNSIAAANVKTGTVYFTAYKEDSTRQDLYRMELKNSRITRLTDGKSHHMCNVSPNGRYYIDTASTLIRPAVTTLVNTVGGQKKLLSDSTKDLLKKYQIPEPNLLRVKTPDGLELPVVYVLPPDYKPGERFPILLSVYGGPGARAVTASFSRSFMYAQFLAQQGVIVVSADHRGAGHHGKIGMNAMHRQLGKWEMADYGAVVDYFIANGMADPERVGITGGSYGGYVTALALVKESKTFKYGIAQYSVTDWQLYDSVYTERYMDTPQQNPDGYRESSVLTHVEAYRGGLFLTHGTVDDNVHMQNTMQLADKLQDARKPFQMMIYPRNRHGIRGIKREFDLKLEMDFWMRSFFNKPFITE